MTDTLAQAGPEGLAHPDPKTISGRLAHPGSQWSFRFAIGRRLVTVAVPPYLPILLLAILGLACYALGGRQATADQRRQTEMLTILKERNQQLERSLTSKEQEREQVVALAEAASEELWSELESRDRELNKLWGMVGQPSRSEGRHYTLSSRGSGAATSLKERYRELQTQFDKNGQELNELSTATQRFVAKCTPTLAPCQGEMTSGFGNRVHPIFGIGKLHRGCDFTAPYGTKIYATAEGQVLSSDWLGGYGKTVEIQHGFGLRTLYAHCDELKVKKGQFVRKGQQIATVGTTGLSSGPHCHYEVHRDKQPIDPSPYLPRAHRSPKAVVAQP